MCRDFIINVDHIQIININMKGKLDIIFQIMRLLCIAASNNPDYDSYIEIWNDFNGMHSKYITWTLETIETFLTAIKMTSILVILAGYFVQTQNQAMSTQPEVPMAY